MNASIPQDTIDRIKTNVPITDVAKQLGFQLEPKGGHRFTTKEHDSLVLFPETNTWYQYSASRGGDVISFLMQWDSPRPDFTEACQRLVDLASITPTVRPVTPVTPPPPIPSDQHLRYHKAMTTQDRSWWQGQYGLSDAAIDRFFLGACRDGRFATMTYTIPVFVDGQLVNIKHRIPGATQSNKYRNHQRGVGTQLFNGDRLAEAHGIVIVAGELKAVVLEDHGIPAVSTTGGCGHWRKEWVEKFTSCRLVYVAYDPEPVTELEHAVVIAKLFGSRGRLVHCPLKPDDYVLAEGVDKFRELLRKAEKVG